MELSTRSANPPLTILAVLGMIAALYLFRPILIPIALAFLLACLLSPVTNLLRKLLPLGPVGAAVLLFVLLIVLGLYLASWTAESLVQASYALPAEIEHLSSRLTHRLNDMTRDQPNLARLLPEPGTINLLSDTNSRLIFDTLSYRLADLTLVVAYGVVVLFLVLFLLAESEVLAPRLVRFFAPAPGDARAMERTLKNVTSKIRSYLLARTLLNIGFGALVGFSLWLMGVHFAVPLGVFAGITNYIPYVGNVAGGALPVLVTLVQKESFGDALIVTAIFLALVTIEGYLVMPYVMGRSLDLNGTTVLIACLFWGFLWGLMGLILAMPITVSIKLVCQHVPSLHRWAELMSRDWQSSPGLHDDHGATAPRSVALPKPLEAADDADTANPRIEVAHVESTSSRESARSVKPTTGTA